MKIQTKNILIRFITYVISFTLMNYGLFSFGLWSLNPNKWGDNARIFSSIFEIVLIVLATGLTKSDFQQYMLKNKNIIFELYYILLIVGLTIIYNFCLGVPHTITSIFNIIIIGFAANKIAKQHNIINKNRKENK